MNTKEATMYIKRLALLTMIVTVLPVLAAYPGETQRGGWAMVPSATATYISTKDVQTSRWFIVSQTGADLSSSVEIVVDGVPSNNPVNYAGSALVWGKNVYAKSYSGSGKRYGMWSIIDPDKVTLPEVSWVIFPETNKESIFGMLDSVRDFIISFSDDLHVGDCMNGVLKPIVDGKLLTDANGGAIVMTQGSTLIARGRTVRVTVSGSCKPGVSFSGSLKLL